MARDDLKTLYHSLRETRFDFVPPGEHNTRDLYAFVQERYTDLCDDSLLCYENCKSGNNSPEWQHRVRTALTDLKRQGNDVRPGSKRGRWIIGRSVPNDPVQLIAHDVAPPSRKRVATTVYRILRDSTLARNITTLHRHHCQICGVTLDLSDGSRYAEAHHIQPLGAPHDGPDVAGNIIVLCPNHHAMCDYGVVVLELLQLRSHPNHGIDPKFIKYHNDIIFVPRTPA